MTARAARIVVRLSSALATAAVLLGGAAQAGAAENVNITANQWCTLDSPDNGGCGGAMVGTDGDPPGTTHHAILGFDIAAQVPAGVNVTAATISFLAPDPGGDPFCVFCTLTGAAIASTWDPAQVSWTHRTSTQTWSTPGGDFGEPITLIDSFGGASLDATEAVRQIVAGTASNNGFLLKSDNEDFALAIDTWSLNGKPTLSIDYELPNATSPQLWGTAPNAGDLRLGDVDGDGAADAVVRESSGTLRLSLSRSELYTGWTAAGSWPATQIQLADVNGDSRADAVGRDATTQALYVALSNGTSFGAAASWGTWNSAYDAQFADLDSDLLADVVGRNSSGDVLVGTSIGTAFTAGASWGTLATSYDLFFADIDADRAADAVLRHTSTGELRVAKSSIEDFEASEAWGTSTPGQELALVDADGDRQVDLMLREASTGRVFVRTSTGTAFAAPTFWGYWRTDADLRGADADGDDNARGDVVGWKSSTRQIFVGLTTVATPDGPPVLADVVDPTVDYDDEDVTDDGSSSARLVEPDFPMKLAFQDDKRFIAKSDFTPGHETAQRNRLYERVAQTGAKVVRFNALWGVIQNHPIAPGDPITYNFTALDEAVDAALDNELVPYITITGINRAWECQDYVNPRGIACTSAGNGADTNPPTVKTTGLNPVPKEYARFVHAVVTHYVGKVKIFSLWNEPNQAGFLSRDPHTDGTTVLPTELYRKLYVAGYKAIKVGVPADAPLPALGAANEDARVLIGELASVARGGRMPGSRFKPGKVSSVTAMDFLEDVLRPRDEEDCEDGDDALLCEPIETDGVALHPYQHDGSPDTRGRIVSETGVGKLTGPAIDTRSHGKTDNTRLHYTGVNETLVLLHKKTKGGVRFLKTPGGKVPQLYLTEFGYFNRAALDKDLQPGNAPWFTELARARYLYGYGGKEGALKVAADARARWMLLYPLTEIPPVLNNTPFAQAGSGPWDTGMVGMPAPNTSPAGSADPAPVTGLRSYGKDPSPTPYPTPPPPPAVAPNWKESLDHPQGRKAYCAVWRWANAHNYATASAGCTSTEFDLTQHVEPTPTPTP